MNLEINNIINFIDSEPFFINYDKIFLFGSFLKKDDCYNDIDLLLLYDSCRPVFRNDSNTIKKVFYDLYKVKIDLVILSYEEEIEISFLKKIGNSIKIK